MAEVRLRVASNRLSRIRRFCAGVQRFAAIDSPARLMIAHAPFKSRAQPPVSPLGVHAAKRTCGRGGACVGLRVRTTTSTGLACDSALEVMSDVKAEPRNPRPPAMMI